MVWLFSMQQVVGAGALAEMEMLADTCMALPGISGWLQHGIVQ
jgi:hypothetical protein